MPLGEVLSKEAAKSETRKPSDSGTQRRSHSSKRNNHGKHNKGNKAAHSLEVETGYETGGESYQQEFYAVNLSSESLDSLDQDKKSRDEAYTRLKIRPPGIRTKNCSLLLKIDTGASGNTLPKRTFQQIYGTHSYHLLEPANNNVILTAYNCATIECVGKLDMLCRYKDEKCTKATFYVVDVPGLAVVGLPTSEQLHLVTINVDSVADTRGTKFTPQPVIHDVNDLKRAYPQQIDTVGNFVGEAKLLLKDDAEAFIDAPRKCSIHMKEKLKQELQIMVTQGVIRKVDEHTDWCSSLAYSTKKDGSIRVCIDPQRLNAELMSPQDTYVGGNKPRTR